MATPALAGVAASSKSGSSLDRANSMVQGTITAIGPGLAFPVWGPMNFVAYGVGATSMAVATSGTNAGTVTSGSNVAVGDSIQSTLCPAGTTVKTKSGTDITFAFPTQTWPCILQNSASIHFNNDIVPAGLTLSTLVGATLTDPNSYFGTGVTVVGVGADGVSLALSAAPSSLPSKAGPVPIQFAVDSHCLVAGTDTAATFTGGTTALGADVLKLQLERSFDGGSTWVQCNIGAGSPALFTNPTTPISIAFGDPEAGSLYRVNCLAFSTAHTGTVCHYRWSTTGQAGVSLQTPAIS